MDFLPVAVTKGPKHHFFGYYDKCPWNTSGRYLLSHENPFNHRPGTSDDAATIGIIDLESANQFQPITETHAWNWQQGSMLQWWPGDTENKILYNDIRQNRFVSVIKDIHTLAEDVLPRPVAALSHDGRKALSLNFARLADERPGYGYVGLPDRFKNETASDKDGIYLMDVTTGKYDMVISLAQMRRFTDKDIDNRTKHWFNHLLFSPDDKRFAFLHRWRSTQGDLRTHFYTADLDGSNIYCLNDHAVTSHFDWFDSRQILAFAHRNTLGFKYFLFTDKTNDIQAIGDEKLTQLFDGHCSYSPDRNWILTDTYPDAERLRFLLLYNHQTDKCIKLGAFYEPESKLDELRCDLHPRWSRDGKKVCFDSLHQGSRQVYIMDIAQVLCEAPCT